MPGQDRPSRTHLRRPRAADVLFVAPAVVATVLDLWWAIPSLEDRHDGHHFTLWGWLDTTTSTVVLVMGVAWLLILLQRRRWPLASHVAMVTASVVMTFSSPSAQPIAGTLLTLFAVARVARLRSSLVALALGIGVLSMGPFWYDLPTTLALVVVEASMWATCVATWLFGRREHRAVDREAQLRDELAALGEQAATMERQRIARELHDILAHSVSAMMMQAAGARAVTRVIAQGQPDEPRLGTVEGALGRIEDVGAQSMRELQRLLGALREDDSPLAAMAGATDPLPGLGDVEELAEVTRQSGLIVQVHTSGEPVELDPSVRLAGYRVVQESLANAMKHAGRGAVVDVYIGWTPAALQLNVRSRAGHDGLRPGAAGGGAGLVGLHERVELVGGVFRSGWVGEEFVTTAVLPLTGDPDAGPAVDESPAEEAPGESTTTGEGSAARPAHLHAVDSPQDGVA
ncbi:sensor histidine kinase [Ornithinimicrobium tianjinense]|uniref:histidine kinase n=1 Tax=Ornithinimicrobium tianjinense TaxID=1195761 RepID=A0A917F9U1_9MICO|nr:histidine kinase [Ornithinimicrobium tianjinense]GGF58388.1 two-component sensor histidine kinase [Ornithinimicrobium tianjinense]